MNEKNFVNFHIITSHSASNLNRDDMGLQKTALFGGKKRVRISSQCVKRSLRKSEYYEENLGEPSTRTRELGALLLQAIEKCRNEYSETVITDVVSLISGVDDIKEESKSGAVAAWAVSEIGEYYKEYLLLQEKQDLLEKAEKAGETSRVKAKKGAKKANKDITDEELRDAGDDGYKIGYRSVFAKELKDKVTAFNKNFEDGIDIALSGRMATSGIMSNVDAALAVAQAITTHTTQSDVDWFTAVDDLSKTGGSAHLDSQEFGAGVFYKYASLNIKLLQDNLGGCDREEALEIAAHTLHMLATVSPSAKQSSYAAFNPADFAMITIGDQPISLANAFETPVDPNKKGGFLIPSIEAFLNYKKKLFLKYGLNDTYAYFTMADDLTTTDDYEKKSLGDLKEWLQKGGSNA